MTYMPHERSPKTSPKGQKIAHPISTNFHDAFAASPTKRLKRSHSGDSVVSLQDASDLEGSPPRSPIPRSKEIPDSEEDSAFSDDELEDAESRQKTGLEIALPPIRTDKEAIKEYELGRLTDKDKSQLQDRLNKRNWERGRTSIYVDAFNLALETVLDEEAHLFDAAELALFEQWRALSYEAQYLYVRLFLRKTAAWHRINQLRYYDDIADLQVPIIDLLKSRDLPSVDELPATNPGEDEVPQDTVLGSIFTFADASDDHITTLKEASSLLRLDELKDIAKEAKLQGKNKAELLASLQRTSRSQTSIRSMISRSETEESITDDQEPVANRDEHFTQKILTTLGRCIRLSSAPQKLFERVHLVFYRSTEWTEKSLTTIILARIARRNFPEYIVSRSTNIFSSRQSLLEFEASLRTQYRIDFILEFNGTVRKDGLETVKAIFEEVYPRWKEIVKEEQRKEERLYDSGEGAYLRRFSPAWVYTRIVHKGAYVLGRFKHHEREHTVLSELLDQRLFHAARRGAWYQRKALLEEHYMWALKPSESLSEEAQKKHWKRNALQTCEAGLRDQSCHLIYHYDLQKRVQKLEKALKLPKREHHDFGHVRLAKPQERTVYGIRIEKERSRSRDRRRNSNGNEPRRHSGKTIWLDEREDNVECSVEELCLSHYRDEGWKGFHSEGGIVRTLFGFLLCDVLFIYIPNVFQTEFQTCPLDLHTDSFYPSRASEINHRLVEIANGEAERIVREVWDREAEKQTCVVGIHWDFELDDLLEIVRCFDGEALATLCKLMAQEYQQRGGGIPDLFLWKVDTETTGSVMFAEVKSENDRLSDTQRLWIHVLAGAGIRVELCAAVAREVRRR